MEKFAPDGGDPEGPMYWNYGTKYNVYLIDGLQTTFGKDYELKKAPGFSKTGGFEMAMIDPIGLRVNFSDSDEGTSPAPEMFWLSREFNERSYYQQELRASSESPSIFHLFWAIHQPPTVTSDIDPNQFFTGVNVVTLRDNWTERAGSFAALKGGNNSENHGHLDLGSFIIDAEGERWAIDLGPDDYDLPGYFDKTHERWTYFRTSTLSHNTLNFDGENQSLKAEAKIIEFHSTPHSAFVMIDLSATYPEKASSILRKVRKEGSNFLIQDEFELKKPTQVTWNFMTRARTLKVKNGLELSQGKSKVTLRILEPKDAKFEIQSAERRPPEERNSGVQMIQIKMKDATGHKRIAVLFETKKPRISVIKPHDLGTEMRGNR